MHRVIDDDSQYVEQALHEYRETTEDCSNFADLHREAQHVILQRAQKLKDSKRGGEVRTVNFLLLITALNP